MERRAGVRSKTKGRAMIRDGRNTNPTKAKEEKGRGQNKSDTHGEHSKVDC